MQELPHLRGDASWVQADLGHQDLLRPVWDEPVRDPQAPYRRAADPSLLVELHHRTAEPALYGVLLDRNDGTSLLVDPLENPSVERLDESHIHHLSGDSLLLQNLRGIHTRPDHRADGQNRHILALFPKNLPSSDGQGHLAPVHEPPSGAPGIPEPDGSILVLHRETEHRPEFVLVLRCHHYHAGDLTEIAQVERTMVGRTILSDQPSAVESENYRQSL